MKSLFRHKPLQTIEYFFFIMPLTSIHCAVIILPRRLMLCSTHFCRIIKLTTHTHAHVNGGSVKCGFNFVTSLSLSFSIHIFLVSATNENRDKIFSFSYPKYVGAVKNAAVKFGSTKKDCHKYIRSGASMTTCRETSVFKHRSYFDGDVLVRCSYMQMKMPLENLIIYGKFII